MTLLHTPAQTDHGTTVRSASTCSTRRLSSNLRARDGRSRIGLVSCRRPADPIGVADWLGALNVWQQPAKVSAVRFCEDRLGAIVVGLGFATITLLVTRPPETDDDALWVAAEVAALCPDGLWQPEALLPDPPRGPDARVDEPPPRAGHAVAPLVRLIAVSPSGESPLGRVSCARFRRTRPITPPDSKQRGPTRAAGAGGPTQCSGSTGRSFSAPPT
jgi:hypothetical protein